MEYWAWPPEVYTYLRRRQLKDYSICWLFNELRLPAKTQLRIELLPSASQPLLPPVNETTEGGDEASSPIPRPPCFHLRRIAERTPSNAAKRIRAPSGDQANIPTLPETLASFREPLTAAKRHRIPTWNELCQAEVEDLRFAPRGDKDRPAARLWSFVSFRATIAALTDDEGSFDMDRQALRHAIPRRGGSAPTPGAVSA